VFCTVTETVLVCPVSIAVGTLCETNAAFSAAWREGGATRPTAKAKAARRAAPMSHHRKTPLDRVDQGKLRYPTKICRLATSAFWGPPPRAQGAMSRP